MRFVCGAVLLLSMGCASTVTRLDGEFPAPIGPARDACEQQGWLVVAPTRVQFIEKTGQKSTPRDDAVALYRVGDKHPEPITDHAESMRRDIPSVDDHVARARNYDTKTYASAGLGAAGLIAIGVGVGLFVSSFKTETTMTASGMPDEKQKIDGTAAGLGGGLVLAGFGLGIAGLAVNPGQAERSKAEAARYAFLPPQDSRDHVVTWTQSYNQAVRERCSRPTP